MFERNVTIPSPVDFGRRNIHNFVFAISNIESSIYVQTLDDRRINGKSILGLLSINISKDTLVKFIIHNNTSEKNANRDMNLVLDALKRI